MKKILHFIVLILFSILISSCVEGEARPQDPLWERESCARCRMVLSEKRFAVQRILATGETHYYDDIVCAMKHSHTPDDGKVYVRPDGGDEWVPAEESTFEKGLRTPMNSGYGAVKSNGPVSYQEILHQYKDHP